MFPITTSYTDGRKNLATLLERVEQENAVALITRREHRLVYRVTDKFIEFLPARYHY
jgi:PHD/YefM family antitoxin component YafN of YafNO toxin-antitoxin module